MSAHTGFSICWPIRLHGFQNYFRCFTLRPRSFRASTVITIVLFVSDLLAESFTVNKCFIMSFVFLFLSCVSSQFFRWRLNIIYFLSIYISILFLSCVSRKVFRWRLNIIYTPEVSPLDLKMSDYKCIL